MSTEPPTMSKTMSKRSQTRGAGRIDIGRFHVDLGSMGPIFAFAGMIIFFTVLAPSSFPSSGNVLSILNDQAVLAILAAGLTLVLLTGEFDLSVAALLGFSANFAAGLFSKSGLSPWLVVPLVLAVGAFVGFINGTITVKLRIPSLIATLATGIILDGLAQWYTGGAVISENIPTGFRQIARASIGPVVVAIPLMLVVAAILWAVLKYTPFGRYLHAIGGNRDAAEMSGIRVDKSIVMAFVIAGMCAALAGLLQLARDGSSNPSEGATFLLPAIAACFLGSATLRRGEFHIVGTIIGVYLIATAASGLFILGAPYWTPYLFSGFILIVATASSRLLSREKI